MKKKSLLKQVFMEFLMLLGSILFIVDAAHPASTPIPVSTNASIQLERMGTITAPLVAMTDDRQGNIYAMTADSVVIRIAPDGTFTSIYSGVERCELSRSALTVLPQGDVIVNACIDHVDTIVKIDREGTAISLLQSEHPIVSLASDASNNVYREL